MAPISSTRRDPGRAAAAATTEGSRGSSCRGRPGAAERAQGRSGEAHQVPLQTRASSSSSTLDPMRPPTRSSCRCASRTPPTSDLRPHHARDRRLGSGFDEAAPASAASAQRRQRASGVGGSPGKASGATAAAAGHALGRCCALQALGRRPAVGGPTALTGGPTRRARDVTPSARRAPAARVPRSPRSAKPCGGPPTCSSSPGTPPAPTLSRQPPGETPAADALARAASPSTLDRVDAAGSPLFTGTYPPFHGVRATAPWAGSGETLASRCGRAGPAPRPPTTPAGASTRASTPTRQPRTRGRACSRWRT